MKPLVAIAGLAAAVLACASLAGAEERGAAIEWPYVGAEQAQTKYSTAAEITAVNVGELKIVWQWEPNERPLDEYGTRPGPFQATPIMVDDVLYLSTMYTRAVALHAETGAELWTLDPRAYEGGPKGVGPRDGRRSRGIRAVPVVEYVPIASGRRGCVSTIHTIEKAADLTGARSLDPTRQASRREWQDRETQDVG